MRWLRLLPIVAIAIPLLVAFGHAIAELRADRLGEERAAWQARLAWRADSQRAMVESWVRGAESDVVIVAAYPSVAWLVSPRREGPFPFPVEQGAAGHLREIFDGVVRAHAYRAAWLMDDGGRVLASSSAAPAPPAPVAALATDVRREGRSRLHLARTKDDAFLLAAAPVVVDGVARGVAVLMVPAHAMLDEALAPPRLPSGTAETALGVRDGDDIVYVTATAPGAPARVPAASPQLGMAAALAGRDTEGVFQDRHGRRVLAAVRTLPTGWGLVVQIDENDALGAARAARQGNVVMLVAAVVLCGALGLFVVRQGMLRREAYAARSQQRLLAMVERIDEVIFLVDGSMRIREALGNLRGLYGREPADFVGRLASEARPPEHRAAMPALFARVREEGRATVETLHLRADGSAAPVEVALRHLGPGHDPEFVAVVRSLVPRETADVRLRAVADNFPGCVCLFDRDLRVLLARGQTLAALGRTGEVVEGRACADALPPEVTAVLEAPLRQALRGEPQALQVAVDGRMHDLRVEPLRSPGTDVVDAVLVVAQDVTELQRALEEHRRLATAIEQTQEMIVITDLEGRIQYVNPSFERTTGYTRAEVLGRPTSMLRSGQHPKEFYQQMWATLARGEVWSGHLVNRRKDGTLYDEDMVISPIRDASGRVVNFAAVKRDVSARLQLERELLQAQKMESVGRLAGGVAHDFNNMLSVIVGYADMAQRSLRPEDPLHGRLGEILRAAQRATSLTRQLLAFSRKQVLQPRVVDLGELVRGLTSMLARLLGDNVVLRCDTPPQPVRVLVDPGQIEQVLLNLAVNARDAMPGGGTLVVALATVGGSARLRVADTGVGMDAETMARAFEPFFTTKPVGKGTGLGLSTVYGIVRQSGGDIRVESEVGRGTTFHVDLPLAEGPTATVEASPLRPRPSARGTVLLTEDDEAVRAIASEALRDAGYRVVEAANAGEALLLADDATLHLDVLVTDVVMPRVGGRELAERLRQRRPGLPVLFTSGFTDDALSEGDLGPGSAFLQKPFSPQELVDATGRTLAVGPDPRAT